MVKINLKRLAVAACTAALVIIPVFHSYDTAGAANEKKIKSVILTTGGKNITKKTYTLVKGKQVTVKVKTNPDKAKESVLYKSSNKKIATVSQKGVITAKKKGLAKIFITVKGKDNSSVATWTKIKVSSKTTSADKPGNTNLPETPTDAPSVSDTKIKVEELKIADGGNTVYGKIYHPEEEGIYPAIIMCHGYNGTNNDFVNECTYFAQNGYVAYAFDFCGGSVASKSTGKSTDMTIFTEKSNLLAVFEYIKALDIVDKENIFLFGGSQGGLVTALATEEVADEVKGMVLYFPAFNIPDDWRGMHPSVDKLPDVIPFWGLDLGKDFVISMHDFDTYANIGKYSKNVLILYGEKDAIVPRTAIDKAMSLYPHCDLITYPNDGHGFTPGTAQKAKQEVLKFMENNKICMPQDN